MLTLDCSRKFTVCVPVKSGHCLRPWRLGHKQKQRQCPKAGTCLVRWWGRNKVWKRPKSTKLSQSQPSCQAGGWGWERDAQTNQRTFNAQEPHSSYSEVFKFWEVSTKDWWLKAKIIISPDLDYHPDGLLSFKFLNSLALNIWNTCWFVSLKLSLHT